MKIDGLKKRYFIKVISSVIIAALNIVVQLILPRAFSLEEFGYYSYNLNVFTSVVIMLNLSMSDAMVSKVSKRNQEIGIVYFYIKYYSITALILCVGIMILFPTKFIQSTFAGQTMIIVLLGVATAIITKLLSDTISIYDAYAISRFPAVMNILLKVVVCAIVIVTYYLGKLNLLLFYTMQTIITSIVVIILLLSIINEQKKSYPKEIINSNIDYFYEYLSFCKPLVIASVFAQIMIIIMNWSLMYWSGAREQALFGAASQFNVLVGYVFSPYAELLKREFAVLYDNKEQLKLRFAQALRLMFWITAFLALFIGIEADWILPVIYGDKYVGAYYVTLLIMYYTVFQSWGQVTGSLMLGMEFTKMSAYFNVFSQALTFVFIFIFQIPNFIWPEGLGAIGMALNYFITCMIIAQCRVWVISRKLGMNVLNEILIPIAPLFMCSLVPYILKVFLNSIMAGDSALNNVIKIMIAGIIYSFIIGYIIWMKPSLMGLSKETILSLIRRKVA